MSRKSLSRLARVRVFDAAKGICHLCETRIHAGERWEAEHPRGLAFNGSDNEDDLRPAHVRCHKPKTAAEATRRSKADRQRANHLGIRKPRTITRWRKFSGAIVYASRER